MKFKKMKVTALCAALALTMCLGSCSDGADSSNHAAVSQTDLSGYGVDDGTSLPRGVWAADDGERRIGYYIVTGENSGSYLDAEYAMGVGFEVEIDGRKANFHMGAADVNEYAEFIIPDISKRRIVWDSDSRTEYLTLINGADPETFDFYSASDLLGSAYTYYEDRNNGAHPEFFSTQVNVDGTVEIQLYDQVEGHQSAAAYYQVDSITGRGKEINSGESVDFSA